MAYLIKNGKIVTENGILEGYNLIVEEDIISKIIRSDKSVQLWDYEIIDANEGYLTPGFIDIHSDYIENMVSPRPTSIMNFGLGLKECEKILLTSGITTMYHSLSFYKDDEFSSNKEIRKTENVKKLVKEINNTSNEEHLIRHRFHARFEVDNFRDLSILEQYIKEKSVHLISFMDHTPGQGQYRDLEVYRNTLKGYTEKKDGEIDRIIKERKGREKLTINNMREIVNIARENNISVASHDDDTIDKLEFVKDIGMNISEFPITIDVAKKAREMGLYTIAGAPNVIIGGSHSGNLSAAEAIMEESIDILCSDYYPQALLHSIFILKDEYNQKLSDVVNMVTLNPAKALKIDKLYGSIEEGKKADLLIINEDYLERPALSKVFVDGKLVFSMNYRV